MHRGPGRGMLPYRFMENRPLLWSKIYYLCIYLHINMTMKAVGAALGAFASAPYLYRRSALGLQTLAICRERKIYSNIHRCNHYDLLLNDKCRRYYSTPRSIDEPPTNSSIIQKGTKLYVANISYETTRQSLENHFERYGNVVDIDLPIDRNDPSKHRGFAFVTMADRNVASYIVANNTSTTDAISLDGRELLISTSFPRGQRVPKRFDVDADDDSKEEKKKRRTLFTIDDTVCPPTDEDTLRNTVTKHCRTLDTYLESAPIAAHTIAAFAEVKKYAEDFFPNGIPSNNQEDLLSSKKPGLILDSGCGTGTSTRLLGKTYPQDLVIGVDRSLSRLSKNIGHVSSSSDTEDEETPFVRTIDGQPNVLLVRAELSSFWRLIVEEGWTFRRHFILYPNPYPKPKRLKSRFYAHPIFPVLLSIGKDSIVRSNWEGYLKEFAAAVSHVNDFYADETSVVGPDQLVIKDEDAAFTNFERKYVACGEAVYELRLIRTCTSS